MCVQYVLCCVHMCVHYVLCCGHICVQHFYAVGICVQYVLCFTVGMCVFSMF